MSLYKQGEIWWYQFTISGKRFRSSCHTTHKAVAEKIESEHRESLSRASERVSLTLRAIQVEEAVRRRAKIWEGVETRTEPPKALEDRHKEQSKVTPKTLLLEARRPLPTQTAGEVQPKTTCCEAGNEWLIFAEMKFSDAASSLLDIRDAGTSRAYWYRASPSNAIKNSRIWSSGVPIPRFCNCPSPRGPVSSGGESLGRFGEPADVAIWDRGRARRLGRIDPSPLLLLV
jgi:hypothetical protein